MFDKWSGLVMAVFFGSRADKHGRKPVLLLSFTGELLALVWVVTICKFLKARIPAEAVGGLQINPRANST